MPKIITPLRKWDYIAAQRPDYFLANSLNTQQRIKKYYHREAIVLYPGIEVGIHPPIPTPYPNLSPRGRKGELQKEEFYLAVGRCIPYKKFDLLIEAFNTNEKKLICVTNTDNTLYRKLKNISKDNIEWKLGISRKETEELMAQAKAFLFPPEEDFWLVPLEAMSHGTPVIAYGKWWALETVAWIGTGTLVPVPYTGIFFKEQSPESLNTAIEQFETMTFQSEKIKEHAQQFSKEIFQKKLVGFIESKMKK